MYKAYIIPKPRFYAFGDLDIYRRALEEGLKSIRESKADVLVLIPPGSSRLRIAEEAAGAEGFSVIAYKGPGEGWTKENEGTVAKYRRGEAVWYDVRANFAEEAGRLVAGGGRGFVFPRAPAGGNLRYARVGGRKKGGIGYMPRISG